MNMITNPLKDLAAAHGARPAVIASDEAVSAADFALRVQTCAAALEHRGIARGERVALALRPGVTALAVLWACFERGVIACPLNLRWPAKAMADALETIGCERMFVDDHTQALREDAALRGIECIHADKDVDTGERLELNGALEEHQPAVIVFTSGSSGTPKATVLSVGNLYYNALDCNRVIPLHAGDRWLLSLPLCHVSGLGIVMRCMLSGAAVVISPVSDDLAETLAHFDVTHASFVAVQVQRLLSDRAGLHALTQLKAVMIGGGPVPATLIRDCVRHGIRVHISYGMTEMASQICTTRPGVPAHDLFTAGRPLDSETVGLDAEGQILVRGPRLFLGYWREGKIERPITPEGWFETGDLGRFDDEGNLVPLGRKDTMFISGGENIHPESVERALCRLVGVEQAVVCPVPDAEFGQRPAAFVRMAGGEAPDGDQLREALQERLPRFALPVAYFSWPDSLDEGMKVNRAWFNARALDLFRAET